MQRTCVGVNTVAKRSYKRQTARSKQILAEKRRAAKILREAGLLQRRGKKITAEYLRTSSYFRRVRREFADVLTGEVRAAKINLDAGRLLRAAGYRVRHGRVIVPKATPAIRPAQIGRLALQPPPAAPIAPRPSRAQRKPRLSDRLIQYIIEWYRLGFDANGQGQLRKDKRNDIDDQQIETLIEVIRINPEIVERIVTISRKDNERYQAGLGPLHQDELPTNEELAAAFGDELADIFREIFAELFYYHHSASVTSGLIWADLTMTRRIAA